MFTVLTESEALSLVGDRASYRSNIETDDVYRSEWWILDDGRTVEHDLCTVLDINDEEVTFTQWLLSNTPVTQEDLDWIDQYL